jgi:hypothetical protein
MFPSSSPLALLLAAWTCSSLMPAAAQASVLTQFVSGNLLGTQSLLKFDPTQGILTGVTFQLTSVASGTATATGILVPANFLTPAFCTPAAGLATATLTGFNGNLSTTQLVPVTGTVAPPACAVPVPFTRNINLGPTAATGALSLYQGVGTLPFTFGISSASATAWTGTLTVNYTYTPEPGTWLMVGSALGVIALRRRKR